MRRFPGSSTQGIRIPDSNELDQAGDITICAFILIHTLTATWYNILGKGVNISGDGGYTFRVNNAAQLEITKSGAATLATSTSTVQGGVLYHAAVTRLGNVYTFYLDGKAVGGATNSTGIGANATPLAIGHEFAGGSVNWPWKGELGEVAYWNAALSAGEIQALAQGMSPGAIREANLLVYLPMTDDPTTHRDLSRYGHYVTSAAETNDGSNHPMRGMFSTLPPDFDPAFVPPANTVPPVISGLPEVGSTLTSTPGTWTGVPTPTLTYQWQYNDGSWHDIAGATSSTWLVTVAGAVDAGDDIRCVVTGTNGSGSASANSNTLGPVTVVDFTNQFMGVALS